MLIKTEEGEEENLWMAEGDDYCNDDSEDVDYEEEEESMQEEGDCVGKPPPTHSGVAMVDEGKEFEQRQQLRQENEDMERKEEEEKTPRDDKGDDDEGDEKEEMTDAPIDALHQGSTTTSSSTEPCTGSSINSISSSNGSSSATQSSQNGEYAKKVQSTLGIARDGIAVGSTAVSGGFAAAHAGVNLGFGIAKVATRSSFQIASFFVPQVQGAGTCVDTILDAAHTITKGSLQASECVTQTSLRASDAILSCTGAARGESYRKLLELSDMDDQMKQAIEGLIELFFEVGGNFISNTNISPMTWITNVRTLAQLHDKQRRERVAARKQGLYIENNNSNNGNCEHKSQQLPNVPQDIAQSGSLSRHMRYAAAVYGSTSATVLGMMSCNNKQNRESSTSAPSTCLTATDEDVIQMLTGIDSKDICVSFQGSEIYRPGHFVAINHKDKEVVVAIRGTLSMHDVLVDLVCHTVEFNLVNAVEGERNANGNSENLHNSNDNDTSLALEGRVHAGFLKSAQRLANDLYSVVIKALQENPNYDLAIVGHSLGGGVATLLTLLWLRLPIFYGPKKQYNIHAYAFASPCCASASISRALVTQQHVTSIVFGDDIVSRLSLTSFLELQQAVANATTNNNDVASSSTTLTTTRTTQNNSPSIASTDEKLFCAGRVLWLKSKEYPMFPFVEINPVEDLDRIELFPEMFSIHLPNVCLDTLEKLDSDA